MKAKLISKEKTSKKETFVFENTVKQRIPIGRGSFAMASKRDKVRGKKNRITVDNWEKF